MQITRKNWKRDVAPGADGMVNITPEDSDDVWALYNLIGEGDEVECMTLRKVLQENNSGEVVDSQKIKMILAVKVEKIDVDLNAPTLRINGKNVKESRHVKLGAYHTLDIEPDRWVKVTKNNWDAFSIEVLEQAINSIGRTEVGAIVMQEGLAHVCSLTPAGTKVLEKIQVVMPKKKFGPTSQSEKAMEKFYEQCLAAMISHIKFDALRAIVIASTDVSLRDELYKRLLEKAQNSGIKSITENKSKFMRVSVASGQPTALTDVLKEPRISAILADTKAAKESKILNEFQKMNGNDPDRVTFGANHVIAAAEQCAVRHLLLSDNLFRSTEVRQRKLYAGLIATVKENGGNVTIFTTGLEPEQELCKLSGVAAILNFPIKTD